LTIITTKRLTIRQITQTDAHDLAKVLADPNVMKFSTVGVHTQKQIVDYIDNCKKQYLLKGYGHWAIYNSISGNFIGVCGLNKHSVGTDDLIHINYRLTPEQQSKGYAIESILGVLNFAKKSLKLTTLYALIEPANINSVKVVDRTGFNFLKSSVFRGYNIDIYEVIL